MKWYYVGNLTSYSSNSQDFWDSLKKNDYFSFEGLLEVLKQVSFYFTLDVCLWLFFFCESSEICRELLLRRFDILQLRIYKTPDLESPKYQILKRTANYEVNLLIHEHSVFCIDIIKIYLCSALLFCNEILHESSDQKVNSTFGDCAFMKTAPQTYQKLIQKD